MLLLSGTGEKLREPLNSSPFFPIHYAEGVEKEERKLTMRKIFIIKKSEKTRRKIDVEHEKQHKAHLRADRTRSDEKESRTHTQKTQLNEEKFLFMLETFFLYP